MDSLTSWHKITLDRLIQLVHIFDGSQIIYLRIMLFGLIWFYDISTIVSYLMPSPVFICILNIWFVNTFCRYIQLNDQTVLFQTIQFIISHLFAHSLNVKVFFRPIDRTLSSATTPGQSGPHSNGNEGESCIPQSNGITRVSPSVLFSVISRTIVGWGLTPQQKCGRCILRSLPTGPWDKFIVCAYYTIDLKCLFYFILKIIFLFLKARFWMSFLYAAWIYLFHTYSYAGWCILHNSIKKAWISKSFLYGLWIT